MRIRIALAAVVLTAAATVAGAGTAVAYGSDDDINHYEQVKTGQDIESNGWNSVTQFGDLVLD
ncbi:hypothetical protein [Streptomyces minutiscleroticus]|uniref:Secreted protein n=1 Tax=Streptomyces minutiscleroticus TaxID=68238 RepID=A0A918NV91_9ACTN|nr:hypothetical protein [Streptomyces minutiscleroticus]GGX96930.1 hypothetical protein GCM10010358_58340 [Streptomyces minutiscleroticus]